jgi:ATP-dependent Clp protease ATP-binding subunit ClpA
MSSKAIHKFSEQGYSELYGAQSFKRRIGNKIENPFFMKILTGDFKLGDRINLTLQEQKIQLIQ